MGRSLRVLHVDDDPEFADLTATFLEREDDRFAVETATNASEGLDRLDDGFDCVVSDYEIPERDGIEFLETVREDYPHLPFILYTGRGSETVASEAISAGVTDYLQKGSGTSQFAILANRIANAVEQYRSRRTVEETERKLSLIAEETDDVLFMVDGDWSEALFVNSRYEDVYGGTIAEFEGDPESFLEYVHSDDRERLARSMERLSNGEPEEIEYRILDPEGNQKWIWGEGKPVFDDDGTVVRIVGFVRDVTERKEHERDRKRYERIVETAGDAIYMLDGEGRFVMVNDQLVEWTGYDREELLGAHVSTLLPRADVEQGERAIREVLADDDRDVAQYEATVEAATGETFPVELRIAPLYDGNEFDGTVGLARDVTGRKERERELRRSRDLLRHTEQLARTGGWEADVETGEQRWTDGTYAIHDVPPDSEFDPTVDAGVEFFHPDDRDRIEELVTHCMERGESYDEVLRIVTADDRLRWVRATGEPIYEDGEIVKIRGAIQDVTERKERERELVETKERLELALEGSNQGVYDWNVQRGEISFDEQVAEMLGYPLDEFEEELSFWVERTHPEDLPRVEADLEGLLDGEEEFSQSEYRVRSKDGEWRWIQSLGTVVERTSTGEPLRVIGVHRDVTERKERERELERQNERLEAFSSAVSHDLRNPLNVAEGRLEMVRSECDSEHVEDVSAALDRMGALIDDLLTLTREGETERLEPVSLAEAVERCWGNVETGEATVVVDADRTIRADPGRLEQLLENLFRNAVEHGGEAVVVSVGALDDEAGFYVEDDGPGIPEDERETVFERGYSTTGGGTGLGLAIVSEIVEEHGWDVRAIEGEGGGARFEISDVEYGG